MPVAPTAGVLPNGFVLLGLLLGIRFSRLTSDAFSPKKLSGVLRVKADAACLLAAAAFLLARSELLVETGSRVDDMFVFVLLVLIDDEPFVFEFHGLVELDAFVAVPAPPKKSPNGSSLAVVPLLFTFDDVTFDEDEVAVVVEEGTDILLFENKSKSSNLLVPLLVVPLPFVHGSLLVVLFHGFVWSFLFHGSAELLLVLLLKPF